MIQIGARFVDGYEQLLVETLVAAAARAVGWCANAD